jgi:hypothetical protein
MAAIASRLASSLFIAAPPGQLLAAPYPSEVIAKVYGPVGAALGVTGEARLPNGGLRPGAVEHRATLQLSNRVAFHKIDSAAGRRVALIKIIDRFSWPRPINGLFIAKDMTETPPPRRRYRSADRSKNSRCIICYRPASCQWKCPTPTVPEGPVSSELLLSKFTPGSTGDEIQNICRASCAGASRFTLGVG